MADAAALGWAGHREDPLTIAAAAARAGVEEAAGAVQVVPDHEPPLLDPLDGEATQLGQVHSVGRAPGGGEGRPPIPRPAHPERARGHARAAALSCRRRLSAPPCAGVPPLTGPRRRLS